MTDRRTDRRDHREVKAYVYSGGAYRDITVKDEIPQGLCAGTHIHEVLHKNCVQVLILMKCFKACKGTHIHKVPQGLLTGTHIHKVFQSLCTGHRYAYSLSTSRPVYTVQVHVFMKYLKPGYSYALGLYL